MNQNNANRVKKASINSNKQRDTNKTHEVYVNSNSNVNNDEVVQNSSTNQMNNVHTYQSQTVRSNVQTSCNGSNMNCNEENSKNFENCNKITYDQTNPILPNRCCGNENEKKEILNQNMCGFINNNQHDVSRHSMANANFLVNYGIPFINSYPQMPGLLCTNPNYLSPVIISPHMQFPASFTNPMSSPITHTSTICSIPISAPNPIDPSLPRIVRIRKQIEYYFSEENYLKDSYLQSLKKNDGWTPIEKIIEFKRLKELNTTVKDVVDALKESNLVIVKDQLFIKKFSKQLNINAPVFVPSKPTNTKRSELDLDEPESPKRSDKDN